MGNTKSGLRKSPYLSISLQKKSFFISEPIQGTIILQSNPQLQISDINISLNLLEGWTVSKVRRGDIFYDSDNDEKYDREFNFTPQITFNLNIQNKNFNNGNYTFPFIIYTNNLTFPSFEYPKFQVRGYLRYIITAGIVPLIPNNPILEYCDEFIQIKSLPLILNTPLSSSSNVHVEKWGLMDKGKTSLYCSISCSEKVMSVFKPTCNCSVSLTAVPFIWTLMVVEYANHANVADKAPAKETTVPIDKANNPIALFLSFIWHSFLQ